MYIFQFDSKINLFDHCDYEDGPSQKNYVHINQSLVYV